MARQGGQTPVQTDIDTSLAWQQDYRDLDDRERASRSGGMAPRPPHSATTTEWERYYIDQAARAQAGASTPRPGPSTEAATFDTYYRSRYTANQAETQFNFSAASSSRNLEEGEVGRRPVPRPTPIFSMHVNSTPVPIFRGLRYYIHKTVPPTMFAWLRSLLIWNGAELGCYRPDFADVIILHFPTPQQNRRVPDLEAERTEEECRERNVWETADLYALLARRTNSIKDKDKLSRRCIVQSEWVEQSVKTGKRLEGGDKGGWEIKVTNDRVGSTVDLASEMPGSIDIDPIGAVPSLSFDLGAGTVYPPSMPSDITWEYPAGAESSAAPTLLDPNNIYGIPEDYVNEPLASSSNTSGVFCKDQVLPLSFYILDGDANPSTVDLVTQTGGGVLARARQATFVIASIRGKRTIDENEDNELYHSARGMHAGRTIVSVEWVDKCINDGVLSSVDPFRLTVMSEADQVEAALRRTRQTSTARLTTPRLSPPPRKPDIGSAFTAMRSPEPMARPRPRKKPRRNVVEITQKSSTATRASPFTVVEPPVPMLPTPLSSPIPEAQSAPSPAISKRGSSPEVTPLPSQNAIKRPAARRKEIQVIDLTLSDGDEDEKDDEDDEEVVVEQILPEQTPLPRSPTPARSGIMPTWRTSADEPAPISPVPPRVAREPTPSLFKLSPGANRRRDPGA